MDSPRKPAVEREVSDQLLKARGPLKRFTSLAATNVDITMLPVTPKQRERLAYWQNKISSYIMPRNPIKTKVASVYGARFNVDAFLNYDPECFRRRVKRTREKTVRIGINVSSAQTAWELNAVRGGAILAYIELLEKQGRDYTLEVCYGNGTTTHAECHVRIEIAAFTNLVTHICLSSSTTSVIGASAVKPLAKSINGSWYGYYRLYEYEKLGIQEFDFALDRIEQYTELEVEAAMMKRLAELGVNE